MLSHNENPKICFKFTKTVNDGLKVRFRWEQLTEPRYEEFIDFVMNSYVKHEISHVVSDIPKSVEAMQEYREIIANSYKNTSYYTHICCIDDEESKVVAYNSLKLYSRGDYVDTVQPQTAEVKRFFEIVDESSKLCPVSDILTKYGVDNYFNDAGCAVHPDFRGYGITNEIVLLRHNVCKENLVPLTGAWMTAIATQKVTARNGWDTIYEIGYKELEKKFGITFHNPPLTFKYNVKRIMI